MRFKNWKIGLAPRSTFDRSIDDFFNDRYRRLLGMDEEFTPAINAREENKNYRIEMAVPGYDKKDLQVTVNNGVLTISSEKQWRREDDKNGYMHREFSYNTFTRSFPLPPDVDDEHIQAEYENGILRIIIPRQETEQENEAVRRVPISN